MSLCIPSPIGFLWLEEDGNHVSKILFLEEKTEDNPTSFLKQVAQQLAEYFEGKRMNFDFPSKQTGTNFQTRVWHELTKISLGETINYLQLARRLGDEKCIRAAASANGKNQLAIVVPCHRVIGSNGKLIGYSGGLHRKHWLLQHESKMMGKGLGF
ncbi:MAG: methylated-DNA--[protein]-cysteine S-methyltransferase [Flavobacteriaceae bacterium]|nr:methylated-DNA--[protein]-cysteine S-methyltransferase [Flavobacteriaceae bacterium]